MSDRRSAIRSTDNRAEKHVAFQSPVRSVTPKRLPSTNAPQGGTPAKQRRDQVDSAQLQLAHATLDDAVVGHTLRVQMINQKVEGLFGQIPTIFDAAHATVDKTNDIVLGLHKLDNVMYRYIEKEKKAAGTLNKFLKDLNEAEELDLSEFTTELEKIEQEVDADIDRLNRLIAEDEEHDKENVNH